MLPISSHVLLPISQVQTPPPRHGGGVRRSERRGPLCKWEGQDGARLQIPFQIAKTFGRFHADAEAGPVGISVGRSEWLYGIVGGFDVAKPTMLMVELHGTSRIDGDGRGRVPAGDPSDEELLSGYRHGDKGAFATLVNRYQRELYHFLVRFLGNRASADRRTGG